MFQSDRELTVFVPCAPGLEPYLHAEVRELGFLHHERQVGGVRFQGPLEHVWRANLCLRSATRVLLRLGRFEAPDDQELYRQVRALDWRPFLAEGASLRVDAQTRDSHLDHSRFLEQRVKDAIVDQLRDARGERPNVDKQDPDLRVHLHMWRNRATLSLDSSGDSLHKRAWRCYQGRAPLAETLAAAMVLASGWNGRAPLLDPFCGSGTILIEAASFAAGRAPGLLRESFAFESWPRHDARAYGRLREKLLAESRPLPRKLRLIGRDIDAETIEGARANADRAGFGDAIDFERGDAREMEFRPGWNAQIITNPPYGERIGEESALHELYQAFGRHLREHGQGYELCLLSGNERLLESLRLERGRGTSRDEWRNGALECELLRTTIA